MNHHASSRPTSRRGPLIAALAVLVVLGLLPSRYGRWVNGAGRAATLLAAPVTQPITQATAWLMRYPGAQPQTLVEQTQHEREYFRTLWLQGLEREKDLTRTIEMLQRGAIAGEVPVRQLIRQVIGTSSDGGGGQLIVRGGQREGVEINTVATTGGVQLVGKVAGVDHRTSWVRLITGRKAGNITGVVMLPGDVRGPKAYLGPLGDGRLQGWVEYGAGREQAELGQLVRLDDDQWPRSARMLVIGTIHSVERRMDGRQWIIVKPTVDIELVSELALRLSLDEDDRAIAGEPAPPSTRSTDGARP
jgi:hypothetical protein